MLRGEGKAGSSSTFDQCHLLPIGSKAMNSDTRDTILRTRDCASWSPNTADRGGLPPCLGAAGEPTTSLTQSEKVKVRYRTEGGVELDSREESRLTGARS